MSDNEDNNENVETKKFRLVLGIDFGTTFSGFAYAYKSDPSKIFVHKDWMKFSGYSKTPTILKYDKSFNVISWGDAVAEVPKRSRKKGEPADDDVKIAERFKLHLGRMKKKPYLPEGLDYKKAIVDYLKELGKLIKEVLSKRCQDIDFFNQVLIVMTVPAEFDNRAIDIVRECAFEAGIIQQKNSQHLKITTEPEAAAVHCMPILKDLKVGVGDLFTIVDCGGGTVDLTTRKLLDDDKLGEITKRRGGFCGGSFVDDKFVEFLGRKVGQSAIELLRKKHDNRFRYLVQEFCSRIKFRFNGQKKDFKAFDLDLNEKEYEVIKQYVKGPELEEMEEFEWVIEIKFEDVQKMFDSVIDEILDLTETHLDSSDKVSALLFVGGFSESKYLQEKVKKKFNSRFDNKVSFPECPVTAIVEGAVKFGMRQEVIATRAIKWTYGTDVARKWEPSDPSSRKISDGEDAMIIEFSRLAECDDEVPVDAAIPRIFTPGSIFQRRMGLDIYITDKHDADFCDSEGVKLLGDWSIDLPITLGPRPILFLLIFGEVELKGAAVNLETGEKFKTTFKFDGEF